MKTMIPQCGEYIEYWTGLDLFTTGYGCMLADGHDGPHGHLGTRVFWWTDTPAVSTQSEETP